MTNRSRGQAGAWALAVLLAAVAAAWAQKDREGETKFEVYQDTKQEWRWRYKAANGEILAGPGEGYKAKADATKAVEAIRAHADALKAEFYEDKKNEHRWRVKAKNNQIIAVSSEGYKKKADAEHGFELLKKGAKTAKVVEVSDKKDK